MSYNGLTNIWLNIKDLSRYPYISDDFMAIDHLRCKKGYCFLSRSKTIKDIPLKYCISLQHYEITKDSLYNYNVNDMVLCKMPNWDTYIPAKILSINDKILYGNEEQWDYGNNISIEITETFGDGTFHLYFASCPESDIYLAWHNGNSIVRERSMLTYKNTENGENIKPLKRKKSENNLMLAPFCFNDSDSESDSDEILKCIKTIRKSIK